MTITKQDIVKALTKEGEPFRKAVEEEFKKLGWKTEKEYPYSLSRYLPEEKSLSKSVDIFAKKQWLPQRSYEVDLIIECKKIDNPDSKWIFFSEKTDRVNAWNFKNHVQDIFTSKLFGFRDKKTDIAYDQIVIYENKRKKEKKELITDTSINYGIAAEVARGLYGIKANRENDLTESINLSYLTGGKIAIDQFWFMPIVVTNADLTISHFQTSSNTIEDGKIDDSLFEYVSVPWLVYEYPLPHYLQITEDEPGGFTPEPSSPPHIRKLPIVFLKSSQIKKFLDFLFLIEK